ncbi:dipeptidyl aminopeptidase/acylaminoacyl peptidase [Streptomyces olivoverticillatus]|uniref:Dipeptidyl aminopeptidase/acylaminoacyl peptidase n=1 Tax=Streptomyces olivoverticillatus TaxID=66427 RepID=A0A7W7LTL4_9ACTN|nr:prolyl oligopeptidase family serine peptidase [Streptomyces olivoverticillatus]MBB4895391.1 dipeptidyl aminopeptidase/acylaminoacyl peptidase [Streptomyces olivoverticillatus]
MVTTAPYGAWRSPVDAALAARRGGRPDFVGLVGEEAWWVAPRPAEGGRCTLVRRASDGVEAPALEAPWDVRSRVHEYGGRPWAAAPRPAGGPLVVFVHDGDQRLYAWEPDAPEGRAPRALTPLSAVGGGLRWADPVLLWERGEVWCVLEEFTGERPGDVRRLIVSVPLDGSAASDRSALRALSDGRHRFVTGPRLSPDGGRVAWLAWGHPGMPWDGTELRVAEVGPDGRFRGARTVLGGPEESVAQVEWGRDGALLAVTDRTGWWNLHRLDAGGESAGQGVVSVNLCPREEEFAGPLWRLGQRWFAPLANGLIAVVHGRGAQRLGILDPETGELVDAAGPWTEWAPTLEATGTRVIGVAASPRTSYEVVELDTCTGRARAVGARHTDAVDPAYYPEPHVRTFTGPGGREIHARVHPPRNPGHTAPAGELPPFVVWAHGGPTSRSALVLDLEIAYFTSRGIGVVDVDYGGSTGYGREYRNRLRERWGVVDVEDCAAVAEALAAEGTADRARLGIRGASAGGWTAAASLASTDLYACAMLACPLIEPMAWAEGGTHDFEAAYLESLIGPFAEVPERYRDRSPLSRAERISAPYLLLQGLDDPICPPEHGELLLAATAGRGVDHTHLAFEGERHGFRRADSLIRALEAELALYVRSFGITPPDMPGTPAHR